MVRVFYMADEVGNMHSPRPLWYRLMGAFLDGEYASFLLSSRIAGIAVSQNEGLP